MNISLPDSELNPRQYREKARLRIIIILIAVALASGWLVFGLPGTFIKKNTSPPDMTGKAYGLRELYIEADGTWWIERDGYLDRNNLYVIKPNGILERREERLDTFEPLDVSGVAHGSPKFMLHGTGIDLKASPRYWEILRSMRPGYSPPDGDPSGSKSFVETPVNVARAIGELENVPDQETTSEQVEPKADQPDDGINNSGEHGADEPIREDNAEPEDNRYVNVKLFYNGEMHSVRLLDGHEYFPSNDSYAFFGNRLYLSTDAMRNLHVFEADDSTLPPVITRLASVPVEHHRFTDRDSVIGREPLSECVFVILANGERHWYDPNTLDFLVKDQLPGVWEQEYASLDFSGLEHTTFTGTPMSRLSYYRVMRILMLIFLASLTGLAMLWRKPWRYISAATTVDSD